MDSVIKLEDIKVQEWGTAKIVLLLLCFKTKSFDILLKIFKNRIIFGVYIILKNCNNIRTIITSNSRIKSS